MRESRTVKLHFREQKSHEFITNSSGTKADEKLLADLCKATDGNPLFVDGVGWKLVRDSRWSTRVDSAAAGEAIRRNELATVDGIGDRQRISNTTAICYQYRTQ
jgi:hypothetical protein